ncbi:MAG TPA: methyl-accepting chemotaxis protein [Lachnospiraceae bacterium]|nr:methyl-accepting chemotaxis protein [Lachnospiraceae bacterium]
MFKFRKIRTKMLVIILPIIILALSLSTIISATTSRDIINKQTQETMDSELKLQILYITDQLNKVGNAANNLSRMVGVSNSMELAQYEKLLGQIVKDNETVLGAGIWFEPYVYDKSQKYVGPYVYKDGSNLVTTYEYSNEEYDYLNQDFYKNVANGEKDPVYTNPYYDEAMGSTMSSCSTPIYQPDGTFIGVITVDIELSTIQNIVASIQIGEQGRAMLITKEGSYISSFDNSNVQNQINMSEDPNKGLASVAATVIENTNGITHYSDSSDTYNLYYETMSNTGWKLMIQIPQSELAKPVNDMIMKLVLICAISLIVTFLAIIVVVTYISKNLAKVQRFAKFLSEGNFTIDSLDTRGTDELAQMSNSLNEMYVKNRNVIKDISTNSVTVQDSSSKLNDSAHSLLKQFIQIEDFMSKVNEAMMSSSAATEEVNASVEEVNSSVSILASETDHSMTLADAIRKRALEIESASENSYHNAMKLTDSFKEELNRNIENAKVVDSIGTMANMISNIAEQINLLSLNASIEAARAGEHGKGFAVVASEIGSLANDTTKAVEEIQNTIKEVQLAFGQLSANSSSLLNFLAGTVTPDYNRFVEVGKQYGKDAATIEEFSEKISQMAEDIERIMKEVVAAIQNIAESAQSTADNSSRTMESLNDVANVVEDVSNMSKEQQEIASQLSNVVTQFKLN